MIKFFSAILVVLSLAACAQTIATQTRTVEPDASMSYGIQAAASSGRVSKEDVRKFGLSILGSSQVKSLLVTKEKANAVRLKHGHLLQGLDDNSDVFVFRAKGDIVWPFINERSEDGSPRRTGKHIVISVSPVDGRVISASYSQDSLEF